MTLFVRVYETWLIRLSDHLSIYYTMHCVTVYRFLVHKFWISDIFTIFDLYHKAWLINVVSQMYVINNWLFRIRLEFRIRIDLG